MIFKKDKQVQGAPWLIVGLGNPGARYELTWHNCGYMALEFLAERLRVRINKARFKGAYSQVNYLGQKLILLKPETYMNLSGESVRAAMDYFKIPLGQLLVLYDDIDLNLGQLRLRGQGSAGTHNGMKSLIQHLGSTQFARLRIGIGPVPEQRDLVDFVLDRVPKEQQALLSDALERAAEGALSFVSQDLEAAMRQVNGKKNGKD